MTQTQMILNHMLDGKSLTGIDALNLYGCFRLPARIADIKRMGYQVKSHFIKLKNDKSVKVYWIDQVE